MDKARPFKSGSLLFAPMEGVTDEVYRKTIYQLYPEWDVLSCDFLRIPSEGFLTKKHLFKHFGKETLDSKSPIRNRTMFQVLASERSNLSGFMQMKDLSLVPWLDLNLGCPSKKVNAHRGGAFLLSEISSLKKIVREMRTAYPGFFTCKIRVGYKDDKNFESIIKLLNDEGVNAITIHARTKEQMYKGLADWSYIKKAVTYSQVPIVGNGDIWKTTDIKRMFEETGCDSVMIARGALKTPWMAHSYRKFYHHLNEIESNPNFLSHQRKKFGKAYFNNLIKGYADQGLTDRFILKRMKGLSRYFFDDLKDGEQIKSALLRSKELSDFSSILSQSLVLSP